MVSKLIALTFFGSVLICLLLGSIAMLSFIISSNFMDVFFILIFSTIITAVTFVMAVLLIQKIINLI